MESFFESCLAFTRAEEGGYVDDPRDSGNWTSGQVGHGTLVGSNMGVGAPALLAWMGPGTCLTSEQMRDLPVASYEAIARSRYWTLLGCTIIPAGVDLMVFDFGWNRGIGTSQNLLARCLASGLHQGSSLADGLVEAAIDQIPIPILLGRISVSGIRVLQQRLGVEQDGLVGPQTLNAFAKREDLRPTAMILALSTAQIASYRLLSNFSTYGVGWLARTSRRQAAALVSATANPV